MNHIVALFEAVFSTWTRTRFGVAAEHFLRQPALVLVVALIIGLLSGQLGRPFGVPSLTYSRGLWRRSLNGLALGWLTAWVAFTAHVASWTDWTARTKLNIIDWAERFPHVPPHVPYFALYLTATLLVSGTITGAFALLVWLGGSRPGDQTNPPPRLPVVERRRRRGRVIWLAVTLVGAYFGGLLASVVLVGVAAHTGGLYRIETVDGDFQVAALEWSRAYLQLVQGVFFGLYLLLNIVVAVIPDRITQKVAPLVDLFFPPVVAFVLTAAAILAGIQLAVWFVARRLIVETIIGWTNPPAPLGEFHSADAIWLDYPTGWESFGLLLAIALMSLVAGYGTARTRLANLGTFVWPYQSRSAPAKVPAPALRKSPTPTDSPIIVLALSGGGIAAAGWVVEVLNQLEQTVLKTEGSRLPIRFAAGASGGMVGAAYHAAVRAQYGFQGGPGAEEMLSAVTADCLSPVVRWWAFHDLLRNLSPLPMGHDRGRVLERAWVHNMGDIFSGALADLLEAEGADRIPSLVFSPMMVETGRRLLISNTDFHWLTDTQPDSFQELFKLFPGAHPKFLLATAARLSATFPLVSPAAVLPGAERLRVVDAGYFDNYGVHLAAAWVRQFAGPQRPLSGRIAFVEMRAFARQTPQRTAGWAARAWEDVTTPIEGLLSARKSVTTYRNDELVRLLQRDLGDERFRSFVFECPAQLPLSWFLTDEDRNDLRQPFGIAGSPVNEALAQLADFLKPTG